MTVSSKIIDFSYNLKYKDIPTNVQNIIREQIVATLGAILGGAHLPVARKFGLGVVSSFGYGDSTALGVTTKMPATAAALYNSGLAQALDWEDWLLVSHCGAAVVPLALALAEENSLGMEDVITAIAIGNEIAGRSSRTILRGAYLGNGLPNHQIGLALMASKLLDLDKTQMAYALSHSCYMAMENCPIGQTSDSKLLINGLPVMWAIASAKMAKNGVTGRTDMVEHPAGYLATVSESVDMSEMTKGLGKDWYTETLTTKKYAGCGYNLSAAECAINLREEIPHDKVKGIQIECSTATLYVGSRYDEVEGGILNNYAKGLMSHVGLCFDTKFCVAAAYVYGALTQAEYLVENATSQAVLDIYNKIELVPNTELQKKQFNDYKYGAIVHVTSTDGKTASHSIEQLLGAYDRPFDHAIKLAEGSGDLLDEPTQKEIISLIRDQANTANISTLLTLANKASTKLN